MSYFRDLREYLKALEDRGKLRRVQRSINKDTELHPLVRWQFNGLPESERAGFLFENVSDVKGNVYNCRVATSIIAPNRDVYALGMVCEPDKIQERWLKAYQYPHAPRLVATGPVKEEIHCGNTLLEHHGIREFAIPIATNGWEALPRLTAVSWISKDPDTGITNIGTYNGYMLGPLKTSLRLHPNAHLATHWNKCRQRGTPLQVAAVIGAVPAISMVGVTAVPYGRDELAVAGGIAGEPIEVVKCETVDLEVPASAEIVLEGEVPVDRKEPDAASGEHTGYMIINHMVNAFEIRCITHRKNPIWHDLMSQMPPSESSTIRAVGSEGLMSSFLRDSCGIPQVKDVAFHHCGGAWRFCVIRMQDIGVRTSNAIVWQALIASQSISAYWPKMVIAVDEDIDPWDLDSVFWAVTFRYQPHRDTKIIQGRNSSIDQSIGSYGQDEAIDRWYPTSRVGPQGASSILMDATRKWDYTPIALPKREYMERALRIWQELGFPPLKPRDPWYGISLGLWPEVYQQQAELGEKGEFDEVAKRLMEGTMSLPGKSGV